MLIRSALYLTIIQIMLVGSANADKFKKFGDGFEEIIRSDQAMSALDKKAKKCSGDSGIFDEGGLHDIISTRLIYSKIEYLRLNNYCPKQVTYTETNRYPEIVEEFKQQIVRLRELIMVVRGLDRFYCPAYDNPEHPDHEKYVETSKRLGELGQSIVSDLYWTISEELFEEEGLPPEYSMLKVAQGKNLDLGCEGLYQAQHVQNSAILEAVDKQLNAKERKEKQKAERF